MSNITVPTKRKADTPLRIKSMKKVVKGEVVEVLDVAPAAPTLLFRKDYFGNDDIKNWTINEFQKKHQKFPYLCEYLGDDNTRALRAYFDFDLPFEKDKLPRQEEELEIRDYVTSVVRALFANENIKILTASRPSQEPYKKDKYKLSLRLFTNLVSNREELKERLTGYLPDLETAPQILKDYQYDSNSFFDTTIYNPNVKLCCVGKHKNKEFPRTLNPLDEDESFSSYLVQDIQSLDKAVWIIQPAKGSTKKSVDAKIVSNKDGTKTLHIDDEVDKLLKNLIVSHFPNCYLPRDLGRPERFKKNVFTIFVKCHHCIVKDAEHDCSNPKMWFVVSKDSIKFKCEECPQDIVIKHNDLDVELLFPSNDEDEKIAKRIQFIKRATQKSIAEYYLLVGPPIMWSQETDMVAILDKNNRWELADDPKRTTFSVVLAETIIKDMNETNIEEKMFQREAAELRSMGLEDKELAGALQQARTKCKRECEDVRRMVETVHTGQAIATFAKQMSRKFDMLKLFLSRPELVAFTNGVYNLLTGEFRSDIKPTDYVFLTTGYEFPKFKDPKCEEEINEFFASIFADVETKNFDLDITAQALYGKRIQEIGLFLVGKGRNGKGAKVELISVVFGDYFYNMEPESLCEPISTSKPKPDLWNLRGRRYINCSEPKKGFIICSATFKKITANDDLDVRTLYGKPASFPVTGLLAVQTNEDIIFDTFKIAENDRVLQEEYPYQFTPIPNADNEFQKLMDPMLKSKFKNDTRYRDTFMLMLLERWRNRLANDMIVEPPQSVLSFTREQAGKNIVCGEWFHQKYQITTETLPGKERRSFKKLYDDWRLDVNVSQRSKDKYRSTAQFNADIRLLGGQDAKFNGDMTWKNIKLKSVDDEQL